jgi:hypothetical protein
MKDLLTPSVNVPAERQKLRVLRDEAAARAALQKAASSRTGWAASILERAERGEVLSPTVRKFARDLLAGIRAQAREEA